MGAGDRGILTIDKLVFSALCAICCETELRNFLALHKTPVLILQQFHVLYILLKYGIINVEMYRIFTFLLCLICIPAMAFDDACTKPKAYTVDKRCYVTNEQKQQAPFYATVALVSKNGRPYCTGTIVKGYADDPDGIYVYTAKHCTDGYRNGIPDTNLYIQLQNGNQYTVEYIDAGLYDTVKNKNFDGDYAIYKIQNAPNNISYTMLSTKSGWGGARPINARVIGYGFLKIMSDAEIQSFKDKYIKFLESNAQDKNTGIFNGGIDTHSRYGVKFTNDLRLNEHKYYNDLFFDNEQLKISECKYYSSGAQLRCQGWSGNSGGGIFDNKNNLMGIYTRGLDIIGGKYHAGRSPFERDTFSDDGRTSTIPIAFE